MKTYLYHETATTDPSIRKYCGLKLTLKIDPENFGFLIILKANVGCKWNDKIMKNKNVKKKN